MNAVLKTSIETQWVGPFKFAKMHFLNHTVENAVFSAPLATYETPLFASVNRGVRVIDQIATFQTTLLSDGMTRSLMFETPDAQAARNLANDIQKKLEFFQENVVSKTSRFAKLQKLDVHQVASLVYLRLTYFTANASGHNMATLASDQIGAWIAKEYPHARYLSVSGNVCADKKVSSVNAIQGRGKHVIAEGWIDRHVVEQTLRSTPELIVELNTKKNLLGSIMAGSLLSGNAHYANMLLAFYLATGQDGANIVEGSQGITFAEVRNDQLYFSVSLPNLIVGTVGNGKAGTDAEQHLNAMNIQGEFASQTLAQIAAAVVWAGELSLLAALTNQHELIQSHVAIERKKKR
jgi:hydroxymethylglutaryl-CoA reductase (NADPH)